MITTSRRSSFVRVLIVSGIALGMLAPSASAVDPPPLGDPFDHFAGRKSIGQEGVITLGDGTTNTLLNLRRLTLRQEQPAGDPAPPKVTVNPPELTDEDSEHTEAVEDEPIGYAEGDLDQIVTSEGALHSALEPGLLVAGEGITSAAGCSGGGFCLTWLRPSYDGDHVFDTFADARQLAAGFGSGNDPLDGTDIAVATGTFSAAEGPSVAVAWVAGTDAAPSVRFAHFVAQRGANGRVTGLQLDGAVQNLGADYDDAVFGPTSPALAVGDFAGTGLDQAAVVWGGPRVVSTDERISATLLGDGAGAGLQTVIATQTFDALGNDARITNAEDGQVGPGAVAQHDIRDNDQPIDRLIVGPGVSHNFHLYRLDVGATFTPQQLTGPKVFPPIEQAYLTANSKLESLGDLDGDGLDELLASPFTRFNDPNTVPAKTNAEYNLEDCHNTDAEQCGRVEILDFTSAHPALGTTFTVDSFASWVGQIEGAVVDARPTKDQRIVPPPGSVDVASLPQVAVTRFLQAPCGILCVGTAEPLLSLASIDDDEVIAEIGQPVSLGDDVVADELARPPRVATMALDGRVELGDPVQEGYSSLEPAVVLNAPPTHFDILGGEAFDPNFCYAGNQYGSCAFESEYERASSTSTEVSTESSEAWGVSSTINVEADFGVAQLGAEVRGGYGENFSKVDGSSVSETVTVNVKARNTDKIYAMRRAYDTLEYPLFQPGEAEPDEYLLASTPHTLSRRWIDSSSPDAVEIGVNHQPGNILSYPEDLSEGENPFISPTIGTDDLTKTTFGQDEFELSDSSDYSYSLTKSKVDADSASTEKTWNVGATLSGGGGLGALVSVSAEVSADYSESDISTLSTTIGDDTLLASTMGGIDESFGETAYTVKPFAYWTDNATLVLDYAVEPSTAPVGSPKTWWQQNYGVKPDLTLNLPRLLDYEEQAGISTDAARFISPGVSVLQGTCANPAPLNPEYAGPGEPLCLVAQVENYSLKDGATDTRVEFYDADPDLGGELIGHDDVPPVAAREHRTAQINWTPGLEYAGTAPRIFAKVEADDTVREVHEENNKGFRSYFALPDLNTALHAAQDVFAEAGDESTIHVDWNMPANLATHTWLVRAYPDDGRAPTDVNVAGHLTSASVQITEPGRYRVVVFAVNGANRSPASHPAEPIEVGGVVGAPAVEFTDAPAEGGYSGSSVEISFETSPADAETECIVDGQPRPCRSPLRLSGLAGGSHTIQVAATSDGGTATTDLIAWTVDDIAPAASLLPLRQLTANESQHLSYRGSDEGGSDLARYDLRVRRATSRGRFSPDPLVFDVTDEPLRGASLDVKPGHTVCVAVRALDGAGNLSEWGEESCTTREIDESALERDGGWQPVRGKEFSNGHALETGRRGSALRYELGRSNKVRVFAQRCHGCGRLEIQVNGIRTKVVDLGQAKPGRAEVATFDAAWIRRHEGTLRLISRGGGEVRVDGIAAWRTNG